MNGLDHFLALPTEKQNVIVDAAFRLFGENGYKKTSTSDIAAAAGISKAMIFHYFGTKKKLYLYLIQLCGDIFIKAINRAFDPQVTDFFKRIRQTGDIKIQIMKRQPSILSFLKSAYLESDPEVKSEIHLLFASRQGADLRQKIVFEGMDASKFKDSVDPKLVFKMLIWMSDGFFNRLSGDALTELETFYHDFCECLDLLQAALYK
ncbi:MAG: TetR/AcrR family transcriptional regulator [Methanobacterium paludis]|nr:TetR/AcrR family transcriptional regulator [Methanobacterium paludis]